MNISIQIKSKFSDQTIPFIEEGKLSIKEIKYHATLLQLIENIDDLKCIIIPDYIENSQYDPLLMIQHIRLFPKICNRPIYIEETEKIPQNEQEYLFDECAKLLSSKEYDISFDGYMLPPYEKKISENQLKKILKYINPEPPPKLTGHDLSNRWGPYKLLNVLKEFDKNTESDFHEMKNILCEKIYFKKLIFQDSQEFSSSRINNIPNKLKEDLINTLDEIQNYKLDICVIDDEMSAGWKKVYSHIFKNSNINFLYKNIKKHEQHNEKKKKQIFYDFINDEENFKIIKKSDLLILDLRLFESTNNDSLEIQDIENLSGIKILKKAKDSQKGNPALPIIISTASNKSWSFEAIINCGANGFWTKESPMYTQRNEFSYYNFLNLLDNIKKRIEWGSKITPIFNNVTAIVEFLEKKDPGVGIPAKTKLKTIFSQLHEPYSDYLSNYSGQSGYEFAFLSAWGLLINDVAGVIIKDEKNNSIIRLGPDERIEENRIFYNKKNIPFSQMHKGELYYYENDNSLKKIKNGGFDTRIILHYLEKENIDDKDFKKLRKIRNSLEIIHGKLIETTPIPPSSDDIICLVKLSYLLLFNKQI